MCIRPCTRTYTLIWGLAGLQRPAAGFPLHPGDHGDPLHHGFPPRPYLGSASQYVLTYTMHTHTHTNLHTNIHDCTRACRQTDRPAYIRIYTQTHIYIHTHAHTRTYIHPYMYIRPCMRTYTHIGLGWACCGLSPAPRRPW